MSRAAVAQAFALPKGGAGSAESPDNKSRTVFQVKEITPAAAASKEQTAKLSKELEGALENDALAAYVGALQQQLGVTVNQAAFDRVRGVADVPKAISPIVAPRAIMGCVSCS